MNRKRLKFSSAARYISMNGLLTALALSLAGCGGPNAEDVCEAIFARELSDNSLQGGQRSLVLDNKRICVVNMKAIEGSPGFDRMANCTINAETDAELSKCG